MILVMVVSDAPLEQQIFGKNGRGLGFLTEVSLLVVILIATRYAEYNKINLLINGVVVSAFITSCYSILQRYQLDVFGWVSRTNGIIGTLGNPNFQSAIAAIALVPAMMLFRNNNLKIKITSIISVIVFSYTIYICQSTQGYLIFGISVCLITLIFLWYRNIILFFFFLVLTLLSGITAILGMLNLGPLSTLLYKVSIRSRGEFFRTAISAAKDNPIFGVGLDSFGDVSTLYKSAKDAAGVNEFTDNAHNYFLNYAVNGGFFLAILYFMITLLAFISMLRVQQRVGKFDLKLGAIFCFWFGFQSQSLISPGTIPILLLGSILNGTLIGLSVWGIKKSHDPISSNSLFKPFSYFLVSIGVMICYPYFNVDRLQLKSLNTGDGILAVKIALSYPESTLRYQRIGNALLESNLGEQALEVGRAAVEFNPNSISAWGLILANSTAPIQERQKALKELLRLDPFNPEIRKLESLIK